VAVVLNWIHTQLNVRLLVVEANKVELARLHVVARQGTDGADVVLDI